MSCSQVLLQHVWFLLLQRKTQWMQYYSHHQSVHQLGNPSSWVWLRGKMKDTSHPVCGCVLVCVCVFGCVNPELILGSGVHVSFLHHGPHAYTSVWSNCLPFSKNKSFARSHSFYDFYFTLHFSQALTLTNQPHDTACYRQESGKLSHFFCLFSTTMSREI